MFWNVDGYLYVIFGYVIDIGDLVLFGNICIQLLVEI